MTNETNTIDFLRAENARLIALLETNGINWRKPSQATATAQEPARLGTDEKVALIRRLFGGREDVYPVRWESKSGKSGYAPACANEWRPGICEKPRIKCSDCGHRAFLPLTDQVIYDHLSGRHTIGVYPLFPDDTCRFLAVDFDEADWRDDALAFARSCRELRVPAALEISRSGNGAHAWIFFATRVQAREARRLGTAIISHTCSRTRQLRLESYDRLFPNQDAMPKGGFGNLIALPLQSKPRAAGFSVFVDEAFQPHSDQWALLSSVQSMPSEDIEPIILRALGGNHPLDVTFNSEQDQREPWKRAGNNAMSLPGPLPKSLTLTLANLIYFEKSQVPQPLANRLIRLAAFQNPEFHKAQAMRFPVWDKPRVIGCADNYPQHIALPRGCLDAALALLSENGIEYTLLDERCGGEPLPVLFRGTLRTDQETAAAAMLRHDFGVLNAPTAFGKTVAAAAIIARRGVSTLILVHRTELLKQWKERLQSLLDVDKSLIGTIGGGKTNPTGLIDIAVMQSLSRQGKVSERVGDYGHVIVDECHHISAFSFESILKFVRARCVLGLTATPARRDGQQPIIFMQCGPVRHTAAIPENAPRDLMVLPRLLTGSIDIAEEAGIQDVFHHIAGSTARTALIVATIVDAFRQGRKVLVLTERTGHLDAIAVALEGKIGKVPILHGRMSKKQRAACVAELDALTPDAPRVLLATGKLVGEGFDHPPLDTLVLAMPISWKGTLQQYAGRLHREHPTKNDIRVIDFVDAGHPALLRMWGKRERGYRAMGYQIAAAAADGGPAQSQFL